MNFNTEFRRKNALPKRKPAHLAHPGELMCYDCRTWTADYVMEFRTNGPEGYGEDQPVHESRNACRAAKALKIEQDKCNKDPFYDVEAC